MPCHTTLFIHTYIIINNDEKSFILICHVSVTQIRTEYQNDLHYVDNCFPFMCMKIRQRNLLVYIHSATMKQKNCGGA